MLYKTYKYLLTLARFSSFTSLKWSVFLILLALVFSLILVNVPVALAANCTTGVTSTAPTGSGVDPGSPAPTLSWALPSPCVTLSEVRADITGPTSSDISGDGNCTGNQITSCDSVGYNGGSTNKLTNNTTYDVTVCYDYKVGDLATGNSATQCTFWSFTTGTAGSAPGKPLNFTHLSSSQTTAQINWGWDTPTSGDTVNEYRWQCGIVIGDSSVLTYLQTGLAANNQYTGYVCACNTIGCGPNSDEIPAYTSIEDATGATFSNIGVNSMDVAPQGTFTNLTVGSSGIKTGLFTNSTCSGAPKFDSGWRTTTSAYSFTGLSVNTTYWAGFQTKNGDGDTNSWSCHGSAATVDTTATTFTSFTVDNSVCAKLTVTVSGAADADSGLDASPYRFSRSRNPPKRAQFSKNTKWGQPCEGFKPSQG